MTPTEQMNHMREQVVPRLQEFGMEAFVITGYVRLSNGTLQRICLSNIGGNPAYEDALRPLIQFSQIWGANIPAPPPNEGA